jgi:hypothetical protein
MAWSVGRSWFHQMGPGGRTGSALGDPLEVSSVVDDDDHINRPGWVLHRFWTLE